MPHDTATLSVVGSLNALAGGLFLLSTFALVATRQVQGCLRFFIGQSIFLVASAVVLGVQPLSWHLLGVGLVNLITKPLVIPWALRRLVHEEVYTRREISQALNIPASLLIALALAIAAYFLAAPLLSAVDDRWAAVNLPIGLAGLLLGGYTLAVRGEAVPQLIGLLSMENGAFFAGIAIAPNLPLIAELAVAFDVLVLAFVIGVLTRAIYEHIGTTEAGALAALKEQPEP